MVQYISQNIITDTMRENEDRNRQLALQELERRKLQTQDQLARGIAGIYAEGAPQPTTQTSNETNYGIAPERSSIGLRMPTGNEFAPQQGNSLSGFRAPDASEIPAERSVTQSVPAAQDTRAQRAMQLATQTPGGGQMAMQLAQHQLSREDSGKKERESQENKVLELLATGNIQGAKLYAQQKGLNSVLPIFSNPRALAMITTSSEYGFKQGLKGRELGEFNKVILEGVSKGQSYEEAFANAQRSVSEMPQESKGLVTDDAGRVYSVDKYGVGKPVHGVRGKTKSAGGGFKHVFTGQDGTLKAIGTDNKVMTFTDQNGQPVKPKSKSEFDSYAAGLYKQDLELNPNANPRESIARANSLFDALQNPEEPDVTEFDFVPGQGFSPVAR